MYKWYGFVFAALLFVVLAGCVSSDDEPLAEVGEACAGDGAICSWDQTRVLRCEGGILKLEKNCADENKTCKDGQCAADEQIGDPCTGSGSACAGQVLVVCTDGKWTASVDCAAENKVCLEEASGAVCQEKPVADNEPQPDESGDVASETAAEGTETVPDTDQQGGECAPGDTAECYHGPSGTKGVGPCKAGIAVCAESGYWGPCDGEVLPKPEICGNGIDEDCNGADGTLETVVDYDGDGFTYCTGDCCEFTTECPVPKAVNPEAAEIKGNAVDDDCNGKVDDPMSCDNGLMVSADPASSAVALAKAAGMCEPWLLSAELTLAGTPVTEHIADGPEGSQTIDRPSLPYPYYDNNYQTYAVPEKFGNNLYPKEGVSLAVLSTGPWDNPTQDAANATLEAGDMKTASTVPEDWINRQPNCEVPKAPSCGGQPPDPNIQNSCAGKDPLVVQDPIMLTVRLKVPNNARAFRMNTYFCSIEYPTTVCSSENYNDFFIALLDSTYNEANPGSQNPNPFDKNLAKTEEGNPVGVDLAPLGVFKVCNPQCAPLQNKYAQYCTGDFEIQGTGFESQTMMGICSQSGCTGWLVTGGNVVPGEEIRLRFAVFEQGRVAYGPDHSWDSTILLDNFEWLTEETKPGTSTQE